MTTPQIGPYTFAGMRGHLLPASAPVVATRWGMRPGAGAPRCRSW